MNTGLLIAIFGGLGAMSGWGISDFFAKKSVDKVGYLVSLFWMQTFGLLPLLIYLLIKFDLSNFSFNQIPTVILLGLIDIIGYLMFYKALEKGKVSIVSPITASYSALSILVSALAFHELITGKMFLILGIVIVGILLTSIDLGEFKKEGFNKKDLLKGVPEALIGVALFSIWFPFWDNFVSGGNWLILLIILRLVSSLFLLILIKKNHLTIRIKDFNVTKWLAIIGLLDAFAYITLTWSYSATSYTSIISVLSATFSLPTLILARIFLKEKIKPNQIGGIALILFGLALIGLV